LYVFILHFAKAIVNQFYKYPLLPEHSGLNEQKSEKILWGEMLLLCFF